MSLLDKLAKDIVDLSLDPRFIVLVGYWKEQIEVLQQRINDIEESKETREVLVHLRDWVDREVIQLVSRAQKALDRQEVE